ncbi:MAG: Txe/YoeB family addiction module toxin [Pseudomonadota bacterium]
MLSFDDVGWEQYLYWQRTDKKVSKRINALIGDAMRNPFQGLGKPEPLKNELAGFWSRRIDKQHRLVYKVVPDGIIIATCRYHYSK